MHRTRPVEEIVEDYEFVDTIKQEYDVKIKYEEVKLEQHMEIKCETIDTFLGKCVNKFKTELPNNSSRSQKDEPIFTSEDEMQTEIIHQKVEEVLMDYEFVDGMKQEDMKIELKSEIIPPNMHQTFKNVLGDLEEGIKQEEEVKIENVENVKQEELIIENECDETYDYPTHESNETQDNTVEKPYGCEICGASFSESNILNIHRAQHSRRKPMRKDFLCPICDRGFSSNRLLRQHSAIHGEKKFFCSVCGKGFVREAFLKAHSEIHSNVRPYVCHVCGNAYRYIGSLNRHKLVHTGEKPYVCSVCSKAFADLSTYKYHMRVHTGVMPYKCKICSKGFPRSCTLVQHMRIHTGENPFACGVCSRTFSNLSNFKAHMRIHSGEKPYICEVCNKAFTQHAQLKMHTSIHTGEKPHKCGFCNRGFSRSASLKYHLRIHTGEKPYFCEICSKGFIASRYYKRHMKRHTEETSFTCNICSMEFISFDSLQQHMRRTKNAIIPTLAPSDLDMPSPIQEVAAIPVRKCQASTQVIPVTNKRRMESVNRGVVAKLERKISAKSKLKQILKGKILNLTGLKGLDDLLQQYDFNSLNSAGRRFLFSMAKLGAKTERGRRYYNGDEKAICSAILRQSPRGYRFLRTILPLPSPGILNKALAKIPLWTGINKIIFDNLKEKATKLLSPRDKICTLVFDEMSLKASLTYMSKYGIITGIEDFEGDSGSKRFADHVLIFTLRGIQSKWTQPIAFYFCASDIKTSQLVLCIKEVLQAVFKTGLKVQVTVCDQGKTNVAAINSLIDESRATFTRSGRDFRSVGFYFKDWEIIHIFDPPHLIKSIRNNLLTKDLTFTIDGQSFKASWTVISKLYTWDCNRLSVCPKLTDRHIIAKQIPKMKVKHAVQVLSRSVAVAIQNSNCFFEDGEHTHASAIGTGKCCEFFDKLFDSVNSRQLKASHQKPLDCVLRTNSPHLVWWREARKILSTMKFVDAQGRPTKHSACIANWSFTLRGFEALWHLLKDQGFMYVSLRSINQDPLENFCGQIRSHEGCNIRPTCSQFIGSFKTIMVNSLVLIRKRGFNCEDDGGRILTLLKNYIDDSRPIPIPVVEYSEINKLVYLENAGRPVNTEVLEYVEGFVAKRLGKIVNCAACKSKLIHSTIDPTKFTFIRDKQINPGSLTQPSSSVSVAFRKVCNTVWNIIPDVFYRRDVREIIINYICLHLDLSCLDCGIHNLSIVFVSNVVNCLLFKWVESTNRKLYGRDLSVRSAMDHVQRTAITKFRKMRKSIK